MRKIAVVLFNLGGPDDAQAVQPFLFNLFNDKAIIRLPQPLRFLIAKLISKRRAPVAQDIYAHIGGGSPLLKLTQDQAQSLDGVLNATETTSVQYKSFICMRYWHPMSAAVARDVKQFAPDEIVLLPLYPQFSTTTTGSSFSDWARAAKRADLDVQTARVCCYPTLDGFIQSNARMISEHLSELGEGALSSTRVLFSAHGLPKRTVEQTGDPYPAQIEAGAQAMVDALRHDFAIDGLDWQVCYQSRVGPMEWIGPSTEDEIKRAGKDGKALIVVPIAFVSEHSETLVELDIEYAQLAEDAGVGAYRRVPAVGCDGDFIAALGKLVVAASGSSRAYCAGESTGCGARRCASDAAGCPNR